MISMASYPLLFNLMIGAGFSWELDDTDVLVATEPIGTGMLTRGEFIFPRFDRVPDAL
jgi:hypothetical protein